MGATPQKKKEVLLFQKYCNYSQYYHVYREPQNTTTTTQNMEWYCRLDDSALIVY
jgi:hypothetical protein